MQTNLPFHLYPFLRPILFHMDPEKIHNRMLAFLQKSFIHPEVKTNASLEIELFGKKLKNPFSLAAGFDKEGSVFDKLFAYGFSIIETGTFTPLGQPGNEGIRIFRLKKEKSLINRMGFNNAGIDSFLRYYKQKAGNIPNQSYVGVSIGKNKTTPNEKAVEDYLIQIKKLNEVDHERNKILYYAINISSPNTPGLRELQDEKNIRKFLEILKKESRRPLVVKFAPDFENIHIFQKTIENSLEAGVDGFILTNTTSDPFIHEKYRKKYSIPFEGGGISGKLLKEKSLYYLKAARKITPENIPLIASGGIVDKNTIWERFISGAQMVQIYTGFIYGGPLFVEKMAKQVNNCLVKKKYENLQKLIHFVKNHQLE